MKKSDFIQEFQYFFHEETNIKKIKIAIDEILHTISEGLITGDRIELRGLGVFGTKEILPRRAKNPKTGKPVNVGLKYKAFFKASKRLKDKINK